MVLKKSNTVLNSGATQRVTNGHVFYVSRPFPHHRIEVNQIAWQLARQTRSPPYFSQTTVDMLDFLAREFGCEDLYWMTREVHKRYSSQLTSYHNILMSMNKKKRWLLPDLLKNLIISDAYHKSTGDPSSAIEHPLASGHEDAVKSLKIRIDDSNASIVGPNKILTLQTNSNSIPVTENPNEQSPDKTKTPRFRGIQRPHTCTTKTVSSKRKKKLVDKAKVDETANVEMGWNVPMCNMRSGDNTPSLFVDVVRDFKQDSRATTVKTQLKRWEIRPYNVPRVALSKGKHSTKGCRYGPRPFTYADLMHDYKEAEDSIWGEESQDNSTTKVIFSQAIQEPCVKITPHPTDDTDQITPNQRHVTPDDSPPNDHYNTFTLEDFVVEKRKRTSRKRQRRPHSLSSSWDSLPDLQ